MTGPPDSPPESFGFLLVKDFALMSFASAVEPLRAANKLAGHEVYRWRFFSLDGEPVESSCGAVVPCSGRVGDPAARLDTLLVCLGLRAAEFDHRPTFGWLRQLARRGVRIGGVSGGPFVLARAGIMDGRHMTIHWEHAAALAESFPSLLLTRSRFIIDRDRLTCAGGIAALDMMHALIAERFGKTFATGVSDWFLHRDVNMAGSPQRASLAQRYGIHRQDMVFALELMESRISAPIGRREVAARIGLSTRQLDRLFASMLKTSFADHYRAIRLERARNLLMQTALPVTEIALACGFASVSHFSRAYREAYGLPPARDRAQAADAR